MEENDTYKLQVALDHLASGLRDSGMHMVSSVITEIEDPAGIGVPVLIIALDAALGDLAFSPRVQNPERAQVDDEIRLLEANMGASTRIDDVVRAMKERLARGQDPFDDDEDDAA